MLDVGLQEMLVICVIALVVFGPERLPELGRRLGRAMREFRRASDEFRTTVETNLKLNEPDTPEPVVEQPAPTEVAASAATLPSETDPYATTETTAVATLEAPTEPFCAQRGSRLFHKADCQWVARMPHGERSWFASVSHARGQGFVACPVCEPWEPGG